MIRSRLLRLPLARNYRVFIALILVAAASIALGSAAAAAPKPPPGHAAPQFTFGDARDKSGRFIGHAALTAQATASNRIAQARAEGISPFAAGAAGTSLVYHPSGPVMRSPVNYVIFWQPPGTTAFPASYEAGIEQFFQDVGGTPYYNVVTQYGDSTGAPVPNAATFGGSWTDTNAFGNAGTTTDPVTDADIQQAVTDAIAANQAWQPAGLSTMYFVYLPAGIAQCLNSSLCFALPGQANGNICAYHAHIMGTNTIYATEPFDSSAGTGCQPNGTPLLNATLDDNLTSTAHEMFEANTDPLGNAWFANDAKNDEIGDLCNLMATPSYANGVDIVLHGDGYHIQTQWSNDASGCAKRFGPGPNVSVSGTLNFGTVPRGTTASQTVTVTNTGGGDANILNIDLAPGSDPSYSLVGVPPTTATLGGGQSLNITVQFSPPAGSTTATQPPGTLEVVSDFPVPNDQTFTVSATSTVGVPDLQLSPAQINFGTVACTGSILDQTLTATNDGTAPVTISAVAMGPGSSPALSVLPLQNLPVTLQPGAQVSFTIQLNGSGAPPGPVTGTVVVTSDDPKSPQSVPVTGTIGVGQITLGSSALGFGGVPTDDRTAPDSATLPLIVSNTGTCPLSITGLTISGPNAADFSPVAPPTFPVSIPAGSDLTFSIRYNPSSAGAGSATLAIASNDPATPSASVALTGSGLIPAIDPATGTLIFPPTVISGQVPGYGGTTLNDTITNTGQAELIMDAITTAAPFSAPGAASPPNRYAPNDGFTEPVTFNPGATGKFTGSLTLADTDPEAPVSSTVALCGEGVKRGIRVLVVNASGVPYSTVDSLTLMSHGTSVGVNIHAKGLPLIPVPTSCVSGQQEQYENQNLPATDTTNQRGSYYVLNVSAGGKSTSLVFTLAPTQFAELVVTVM
jgi:hypothetical protein